MNMNDTCGKIFDTVSPRFIFFFYFAFKEGGKYGLKESRDYVRIIKLIQLITTGIYMPVSKADIPLLVNYNNDICMNKLKYII